ncbi:MAG: acyloxyacyl hydrolase [Phaeodactylibacter sp.]|nr:acyloxyacyl hydrolase [Phaeodactylibacter sp.]MCB9265130.1 acyloxyacyl hydrolase [Lewinellaceae bacterium]MCB9289991.1 acyloxyacyl hydrolase [Lewinellaceae bacterium]
MRHLPAILPFFLALSFNGSAQPLFRYHASAGLGYSIIAEQLPEGYPYKPFTILPSARIWKRGHLILYAEGQFTQATEPFGFRADYEAGVNVGVRFLLPLAPQLTLKAAIASGPHFITVETRRQANGFIFSDNFELSAEYYLKRLDTAVQARWRYRHISNAGLQAPNGGIDNLFLIIGVAKRW